MGESVYLDRCLSHFSRICPEEGGKTPQPPLLRKGARNVCIYSPRLLRKRVMVKLSALRIFGPLG